jgi:sugar transferase (PEP-CTERM/EpsH1 system associated)
VSTRTLAQGGGEEMRILFMTPELPSPPTSGGTARMHGLISNVAKRHDVAVLAIKPVGIDVSSAVHATGRYARLVVTIENPHIAISNLDKRRRQLRSLISHRSYERLTYHQPRLQRTLERMCREWRPDAIVVEFAQMGYARFPADVPVVLDAHNVEHEIVERQTRIDSSVSRRLYSRVNARKLQHEERALLKRVDGVAATSARDAELLTRLAPGIRPVVVPNGVDCEAFAPRSHEIDELSVLFFGSMDYFPNTDAALYFAHEIWPSLRRAHPVLAFDIVGRRPPEAVRALESTEGIRVAGLVEDIRNSIAAAAVVVVPLRAGSGTRLKVLEAMAMGVPVVSTRLGVEGLNVVDSEHLLIADEPGAFSHAVASLLASPEARQRMGTAARKLVVEQYDWQAISADFERLIAAAVHARQR